MADRDSQREIALLRLVAQGVTGSRRDSPERVVQRLLCLQAQDYWSGIASVALRSASSATAVEATLNAGTVVRGWPLRGTLHLVGASDIGWLRELLAGRELAAAARQEARLGIDSHVLGSAERIAVEALSSHGPSTRAELTAAWQAGGIDTSSQRGYHLIWHLAHTGTVLFGPVRNGQQLLALAGQQTRAPAGLTRDEALTNLARRYFDGHGPATPADLARWANLTIADTKLAVAAARPHLAALTVADTEYLLGPGTQDELASCRKEAQDVMALPGFDEMLFGYRDRTPTLPDDRSDHVFPHRNGIPSCTVIVNGQVAATWRRPTKRHGEIADITPLVPLTREALRSAARKAAALA
ncbi:MAG TPA: winged helix DNA-binding domain-containing protein [Streptosporangiaceae bacterium]|nr:winged helix DNA-binding domain-containing protein [Streptosporangiaceae bacterium]